MILPHITKTRGSSKLLGMDRLLLRRNESYRRHDRQQWQANLRSTWDSTTTSTFVWFRHIFPFDVVWCERHSFASSVLAVGNQ